MNDYKRILLVVLGVALLICAGIGIRGAIDSSGAEKARLYNTALQATKQDRFNYAVDSHQGRVIGSGTFTATKPVKFPEMSKTFAYIDKTREEYTMHTREVCSTDSDGNEHCHTETYYSWEYAVS